jgi:hypothetical protein
MPKALLSASLGLLFLTVLAVVQLVEAHDSVRSTEMATEDCPKLPNDQARRECMDRGRSFLAQRQNEVIVWVALSGVAAAATVGMFVFGLAVGRARRYAT